MNYLRVPNQITLDEIRTKDSSLSAGMYRRVVIPTSTVKRVSDLLDSNHPFEKGVEPGSLWYMKRSTHHFIRTKALQDYSSLLYPKGGAIVPINPRAFENPELQDGDILMSKDSNVGECAIIDGDQLKNHMFSGGIVRLHPTCDRHYFFSFLKHPLFKTQLLAMLARGATITHAKTIWLDCLIPFPNQENSEHVIKYVSILMQAIVEKEKSLRARHEAIHELIGDELANSQSHQQNYSYPTITDIRDTSRLDTGLYCREFQTFKKRTENYKHGVLTLSALGVKSRRGPNLAVSVIGKSLYSDTPKSGWYALIRPTNITDYGTLTSIEYLGNRKRLPTVNKGEIIFGCEATWRSLVLVDGIDRCTTNFHGTVLYWDGAPLESVIWLRCLLEYLRQENILRYIAVGGQGGHLSPEYFDYIPIPKFPEGKQVNIARLYHNPTSPPEDKPTLDTFVDWHRSWNENLGIWELNREMKSLQHTLADVQEKIIEGKTVQVPL